MQHPTKLQSSPGIYLGTNSDAEAVRFIAITALGMCRAIRSGVIDTEYACHRMFGPALLSRVEAMATDEDLCLAIHLATELADVQALAPEALEKSIDEIEAKLLIVLRRSPAKGYVDPDWLEWIRESYRVSAEGFTR